MKTKLLGITLTAVLWLLAIANANAFYNPHTGRWLSRDPIREKGGENLYGFVRGDAVAKVDAKGLNPLVAALAPCAEKLFEKWIGKKFDKLMACGELANRIIGTTRPRAGEQDAPDIHLCKGFSFEPYYEPSYKPGSLSQELKDCVTGAVKGVTIEKALEDIVDSKMRDLLAHLLKKALDSEDIETTIRLKVLVKCVSGEPQLTIEYETVLTSAGTSTVVATQTQQPFACGASTLALGLNLKNYCCCNQSPKKKD